MVRSESVKKDECEMLAKVGNKLLNGKNDYAGKSWDGEDFCGVKLTNEEYDFIKPLLRTRINTEYQIGKVTLNEKSMISVATLSADGYVYVQYTGDENVVADTKGHLYNVLRWLLTMENVEYKDLKG